VRPERRSRTALVPQLIPWEAVVLATGTVMFTAGTALAWHLSKWRKPNDRNR